MATDDGEQIRRQILGDDWVREAQAGDGDALDHFSQLAIDQVWRAYWSRPGLETHLRSVATIAALASLEAHGELVAHVRGALRNGDLLTESASEPTPAGRDENAGESDVDPQIRHSQQPSTAEGD